MEQSEQRCRICICVLLRTNSNRCIWSTSVMLYGSYKGRCNIL